MRACVHAYVRSCVLACVRACVRACLHACMSASVQACVCVGIEGGDNLKSRARRPWNNAPSTLRDKLIRARPKVGAPLSRSRGRERAMRLHNPRFGGVRLLLSL
ncbi:hypothetical protein EVAR_17076_1 [Eumeta japonica]|uniref:Secreted protein n=1 Tax=Eumeta variegata TaxID=151549 RepID=A0A4C1V4L2_EUMVA|nr:hypothetical protein EVAR_17076_1 [Eumeta japonica]